MPSEAELEQELHNGPYYDEDHGPSGNPTDEQIEMFLSGISLGAVVGSIVGAGLNSFVAAADLGTPMMDAIIYATPTVITEASSEAVFQAETLVAKCLIESGELGSQEEVEAWIAEQAKNRFIKAGLSDAAAQLSADAEAQSVVIAAGAVAGLLAEIEFDAILAGAAQGEQAAMSLFFTSGL